MNFYKRHLGDIAKSCGDLSQGQMGAYDLLCDWHYANEEPLPLDKARLYRIGRAVSKVERANVDLVLELYFDWTPEGYTQKRALEEMAKAQAQADTNRRIAEEREARKRARQEHEALHDSSNESPTNPTTNRQPSHKPLATSQEAFTNSSEASTQTSQGDAAERACQRMVEAGLKRPSAAHPDLLAALAEGVSPEALGDAAREAIAAAKSNPLAWAIATARGRHAEGPRPVAAKRGKPEPPNNPGGTSPVVSPDAERRHRVESLRELVRQHPEARDHLTAAELEELDDAA